MKVNTLCDLNLLIVIPLTNDYTIGFIVFPEPQTVYVADVAVFRCRYTSVHYDIQWRVNGTVVNAQAPPQLNPGFITDEDGNIIDTLNITATPNYNNTEVVCVAKLDTRSDSLSIQSESTQPAILQGWYYVYVAVAGRKRTLFHF